MVNKSYMNSFGPAYGQDDRTTFFYESSQYSRLKPIVDKIDITIYRDGESPDLKDLEMLIRAGDTPADAEVGIEMIPLQGAVGQITTRWTKNHCINQRLFTDKNKVCIGVMDAENKIYVLTVWYSREAYRKEFPDEKVNKKDCVEERDFQQPIEREIRINKQNN